PSPNNLIQTSDLPGQPSPNNLLQLTPDLSAKPSPNNLIQPTQDLSVQPELNQRTNVRRDFSAPCGDDFGACRKWPNALTKVELWNRSLELYNDTITHITKTIEHLENIVPEHNPTINRRSLLPFIGKIGKGLFGFATTAIYVNQLIKKSYALGKGFEEDNDVLQSFIKHTDSRFTIIFETITENHNLIFNLSNELLNNFRKIHLTQSVTLNVLPKLIRYNDIIDLIEGKLSEAILSFQVLANSINNISTVVAGNRYRLTTTDPVFYYKKADFYFFKHNKTLNITIKFPIVHPKMILNLYQILAYPVPIDNTSLHPEYLAVSQDNDYFVELNQDTIDSCDSSETNTLYSFSMPLSPITFQRCSFSLLLSNKTLINSNCNFDLTLQCPDITNSIVCCHFCLMTIPCNCTIITVSSYIPPRFSYCHHHSTPITTLHPETTLAMNYSHTSFESPLNISIQSFKLFIHNFSKLLASDSVEHLNLNKMAEATRRNQEIYS
ncbi:Y054-like protein, partial [Mya arenaria]